MENLQEYKCPCCGGAVVFDSSLQKMKCPYCDTEFEIDALKEYSQEVQSQQADEMNWEMPTGSQWKEGEEEGLRSYICKSCGGEIVGDVACSDAGQFEYINEHTICAETSGKIASVSISQGDSVKSGQTIAKLDSSSAQSAAYTAKLTVDDAKLGLERAKKGVNDYTITAPISGTVVTKNNKAGDKVDSSNATTPMCIIYDMSSVQFDLNVDEIDVAKIKVGQEVTVTADAVSDKTFKGVVEKVSLNGTSANGVTNYPVTVAIADYGELLPGMNIDAEIIVDKAENVVSIPVGSLVRGNIVYVQGDKEREDDNAPEGYKSVEVKTGISDDNFIEIKSGLNENDVVRGQEVDRTSDLQKMMMQGMEGGPEEGDGPPSGGGPHGGGGPNGGASGGQQ